MTHLKELKLHKRALCLSNCQYASPLCLYSKQKGLRSAGSHWTTDGSCTSKIPWYDSSTLTNMVQKTFVYILSSVYVSEYLDVYVKGPSVIKLLGVRNLFSALGRGFRLENS